MSEELLDCWICGSKHDYEEKVYDKWGAVSARARCPESGLIVHAKLSPIEEGAS